MTAKKILIVDDDAHIRKLLANRLKIGGFEVSTADGGEQAMALVKEVVPDLVLLDVMMPPPNGLEICRMLKDDAQFAKIPVILLTGKSSESDFFWGQEAGADDYITKPYNADELMGKIERLLSKG